MGISIEPAMRVAIETAVEMLVIGDYEGLERVSQGRRLTAEEIRRAVTEFGSRLVAAPSFDSLQPDVVQVKDVAPPRYSVVVDLWAEDKGRSDLSLELTLVERPSGLYDIEIDNLHVL